VLRILFWNLNREDLRHLVCDAANATLTDVVILIESRETSDDTLQSLRTQVSSTFYHPVSVVSRFQVFSRNQQLDLSEFHSTRRTSFRRLSYAGTDIILGAVHVVDKLNWDQANQATQVTLLAADVHRWEKEMGHDRTILIGDFNVNPFEQVMNMAAGLNAMMTVKCVERGHRTQQDEEYRFFYNPMWNLFGDRTPGPSGTYYHRHSSLGQYGWNMLDQVLLRPSTIPLFNHVEILTSAGATSLQDNHGRPDAKTASDHFPILITLK
jgi:endonuclease/exonuclease/phosphatase family metal-dependent hydrolase